VTTTVQEEILKRGMFLKRVERFEHF